MNSTQRSRQSLGFQMRGLALTNTRRNLLRRFPFSVAYRVELQRMLIVAVAHARRRPGYWKPRLPAPRWDAARRRRERSVIERR